MNFFILIGAVGSVLLVLLWKKVGDVKTDWLAWKYRILWRLVLFLLVVIGLGVTYLYFQSRSF